jgi:hypothetical protein
LKFARTQPSQPADQPKQFDPEAPAQELIATTFVCSCPQF